MPMENESFSGKIYYFDREKFIEKLRRVQREQAYSQRYIGQRLNRSDSAISRMMNQEFDFSLDDMVNLNRNLNLSLDNLIADDRDASLYLTPKNITGLEKFDLLFGDLMIEIDEAPRKAQDEMLSRMFIAIGSRMGFDFNSIKK